MDRELLIYVLAAEAGFLFFFLLLMIFHRTVHFFRARIHRKRKRKITDFLLISIEKPEHFQPQRYPGRFYWRQELLETLEAFNVRIQGDDWDAVKGAAARICLLPAARKRARSLFWKKRNFAARAFTLFPLPSDEALILRLMDDRKYLVQRSASQAGIALGSKEAIRKILLKMSADPGFGRFFLRDALLHGPPGTIQTMVEEGKGGLHEACLDVLSARSWPFPLPFLSTDVHSEESRIRRFAVAALIRNPLPHASGLLNGLLKDDDEEIRILAAQGLSRYSPAPHFENLEKALSDDSWFVRIEAARTLQSFGPDGVKILQRQESGPAVAAVKYIGQFA